MRRPTLRVYIERPNGEAVDIGDCVAVNDAITDLLDAEDMIPTAYLLEVSSPGLSRPLKRTDHFLQQLGKKIRLRTWEPIEERRNWAVELVSVDEDVLTVKSADGREYRIPVPAIERAHLVYEPEPKGQKKGEGSRRKRRSL